MDRREKYRNNLLMSSTKGCRRFFVLGFFCALGSVASNFVTPLLLAFVADYVLSNDTASFTASQLALFDRLGGREYFLSHLWVVALVLLGVTVLTGLLTFGRSYSMSNAGENTARNMREKLYRHLADLPYDYHKHAMTGDLIQRCTSDVDTVRRFVAVQLTELLRCIFSVVLSVAIMSTINVKLTLISLIGPPIVFIFSFGYFKKITTHFTECDEAEGKLSAMLNENVSGVRVVRAFGQQRSEYEKFNDCNTKYRDVFYNLNKLFGRYWGFSDLLACVQVLLTLSVSIYLAATGEITLGTVIIFSTYTNMLTWPMRQLGRVLADMGKGKVSLGRLNEIMDAPVEKEPGKALRPEIKGDIEFKNVCFGYDSDNEVLDDISFKVKCGQTVAVLGSTGSGKSSLMHLLERLYECRSGAICIDGVNVNDIESHHLRQNIGIVMQEPFLYSRSIADNIRMSNSNASDAEIVDAAKSAAVHDTISRFRKGYDTMVGERGVTLSGGEKQRVSIARTLLQNAPILIFDDSLSAVDAETDAAIRKALAERRRAATTFIISHRINTLCESDFVIVLENGRITEMGTHDELLSRDGLYRRIAKIQAFPVPEREEDTSHE